MPFGKCKETTKGLNKGGADLSNEELRRGHLIGLAKKGQGSDDYNFITPGVDNIAARHVCITDADQLQPVLIDQLEKGAINTGKVLWVTSVEPCYRVSAFAGLTMLVEDKDGRLAILVLYNVISANATSLDAQMIFPVGTRLGIKEPYYKLLTGRCFGLRSDNPCNVIIERPKANSTGETTDALMTAGKKLFADQRFEEAAEIYGSALLAAESETARLPLYLERAAARLECQDYSGALADCESALAIDGRSAEGQFRRGRALLGLRRYSDARDAFAALAAASGGGEADKACAEQLRKAEVALEQSAGRYDLLTFPFAPEAQGPENVAEYFGPVEVRWTDGRRRGRGLFLTADAGAGQLLMAERALGYCLEDPRAAVRVHAKGADDEHAYTGSQLGLVSHLALLAHRDPRTNAVLARLSTGEPGEDPPPLDVADLRAGGAGPPPAAPVSAFAIKRAIKVNAFGFRACREPGEEGRRAAEQAMRDPAAWDPSQVDWAGDPASGTPLHRAVAEGDEGACAALLAAGADANARDRAGATPLHLAAGHRPGAALAAALLDGGADVDARDRWGFTPLNRAVRLDRPEAVPVLLARGADPHAENYLDGGSPLDVVRARGGSEGAGARAVREAFAGVAGRAGAVDGTALWGVASLMNHAARPSTRRRMVGQMMFVTAGRDLRAGEELTHRYSANPEELLRHWNIVD